jgi:hypothetical protein
VAPRGWLSPWISESHVTSDLLAEAEKMGLQVNPVSGEDVQAFLAKIYASPPDLLQKAKEAIKVKR